MALPMLDLRPLQEGHALRGIGRYCRLLLAHIPYEEGIAWGGADRPEEAARLRLTYRPGCATGGRTGWLVDALRSRRLGSLDVHAPLLDARLGSGSSVITVHDLIPWRFAALYPAGRLGHLRMKADERAARRADRVIAVSASTASDAVAMLGVREERVRVVHHAAGAPWPEPVAGSGRARPEARVFERRYVVASGGFRDADPRKRLGDLVAVLPRLPEDVALVLTGVEGPHSQPLLARAAATGVTDRLLLTGQLSVDRLVEVVAGAAAFAMPSAWEGFGLPLLEAMTVGVPAVVSDGGALPEVAGPPGSRGATIVPVGDLDALAGALAELLTDGGRAEQGSRAATARAAQLSCAAFRDHHLRALSA